MRPLLAIVAVASCGRIGFTVDAPPLDAAIDTPPPAPVVFDTSVSSATLCMVSPCSYSHTLGPGSNGIVVIWYFCADGIMPTSAVTVDGVSAISVGATALTKERGELWYALATPAGTHAIAVSHTCVRGYVASMSALGVDQTNPIRTSKFDDSDPIIKTIGDTIASASGDLMMDGVCHGNAITGPGVQQTQQYLQNITGGFACGSFAGSTEPGASPSVTTAWSSLIADHWAYMAVSLQPAP